MRYMKDKKGQGFDTFKLLIAAVVAMVILGIVTGVFGKIWGLIAGISCVSNPIGEITSKIQSATTGMVVVTQVLCFSNAGEEIESTDIEKRLSNVAANGIDFYCGGAVCSAETSPITVSDDHKTVTANRDAQFKVKVDCDQETTGDFTCDLTIVNA